MKRIILMILILSQPILTHSISEEPYCYAASDFMVAKYKDYPPQLIALYDNTDIFFDINNDGVWEYKTRINKNKPYYPKTSWDLQSGSYIHSSKPIIYNQKIYEIGTPPKNSINYQCVPPISSLKKRDSSFSNMERQRTLLGNNKPKFNTKHHNSTKHTPNRKY